MKKKIYKVIETTNRGKHVYYKSTSFEDAWNYYIKLVAIGKCGSTCGVV